MGSHETADAGIRGWGKIRILLADQCPVVLRGLETLLAPVGESEVVGWATTSAETLFLAATRSPDAVVLDPSFHARGPISMRDGYLPEIDSCRELRYVAGPVRIVAYSAFNTIADLMALRLVRVDGYVHKSTPLEQLARDLGNAFAGRSASWRLGLDPDEAQRRLLAAARVERLSRAEKAILGLVLKGRDDKQMAESLSISIHTVKKHVASTLRKLEYRNRKELFCD